jgi:drug/metabolite transporter (DMT)-like permease
METTRMPASAVATLLAVGCIFGSSFLAVKLLVAEMPPAQLTAWRLLLGGVAVIAVIALRRRLRLPGKARLVKATVLTLLDSVIPNTLLAWAQIRLDSGIAAVLMSSMPFFTVLFAMALPRPERLTIGKAIGLTLGIAGVIMLVGADSSPAASGAPAAHLAAVLAAASNAAAVVYARRLLTDDDPLELSGIKLAVGAIIAFPLAAALDGGDAVPQMGASSWCALLVLAVLSNAVGRTMYHSLIASVGSVRASLVAYVVPAVGVSLGWLVLGEHMRPGGTVGLTLIAIGMASVTHGPQVVAFITELNVRRRVGFPAHHGNP